MPPQEITSWIKNNYPKPIVDPDWLQACYDWVLEENQLNPATDMQRIIKDVEIQLLESDLHDSMVHGTGIPADMSNINTPHSKLTGPPILVQIVSITDVGVSAYALNKTRVIRAERMEAGEEQEGEADDEIEGQGPIPNYTRSMLKFEISDGATTLTAAEYRPIPDLVLGVTALGCKLQIKNAEVRRGVIFLEPRNIEIKGHRVSDREVNQESDFARGLRVRMKLPEPDPTEPVANGAPIPQNARSPLRDISPPPSPTLLGSVHPHSDDEDQPRRRRIPNPPPGPNCGIPSSNSGTRASSSSSFFNETNTTTNQPSSGSSTLRQALRLSPTVRAPTIIESDDDDDNDDENEWKIHNRPVKPIPSRARTSTSSIDTSTHKKGKHVESPKPESDYGDDDFYDDLPSEILDNLDQLGDVEGSMRSMSTSALVASVPSAQAQASLSLSSTSSVRSATTYPSESTRSPIIIDDCDEEDDKENLAVATRHVRRRMGGGSSSRPINIVAEDNYVMELTDSDSDVEVLK